MNFAYLFAAIQLFDTQKTSLKSILFDARKRLRFTNPPPWMADEAERRGTKFLDTPLWRDISSGWLEPGPVYFPVRRHPETKAEILDRLEWMLDHRRDANAGSHLWKPVCTALASNKTGGRSAVTATTLNQLAIDLERLRHSHRAIFDLLMAGRLADAQTCLQNFPASTAAMRLTRTMTVFWLLFDLQIVAYRLLRSEFVSLDQPLTQARYITYSRVEKLMRRLQKMAELSKKAFDAGLTGKQLDRRLKIFITKSNLPAIADIQLQKRSPPTTDLVATTEEVRRLLDRAARWTRRLERVWNNREFSFALSFKQKSRSTYEIDLKPSLESSDKSQSATAIQFGAPAVTLLLFAVTEAISDFGRQPRFIQYDEAELLSKRTDQLPLLNEKARQALTRYVFVALMQLYARPSGSIKISEPDLRTFRYHALQAHKKGQNGVGLEPTPLNAMDFPLAPFAFGVPSDALMPERIRPIDTGTLARTRALLQKATLNADADRVVEQIHRQFKSSRG